MSLKILIDMNLSPLWVPVLQSAGFEAVHWSSVGIPAATDQELMNWARRNAYIVLTHDLDFGAILAATQALGPSVIQVRTQDVLPAHLSPIVITSLRQYESPLRDGALIIVDETKLRARILPLDT